jgi:phosphate transporter
VKVKICQIEYFMSSLLKAGTSCMNIMIFPPLLYPVLVGLPVHMPWVALVIILLCCLSAATFISHTVAALIFMPIISTLGVRLGMPEIAVIGSAFASKASLFLGCVLYVCLNTHTLLFCCWNMNRIASHRIYLVSAAMALPFSSFPNVNSVLLVDDFQRPYLAVGDFIKTGLPLSLVSTLLVATLGYLLIDTLIV